MRYLYTIVKKKASLKREGRDVFRSLHLIFWKDMIMISLSARINSLHSNSGIHVHRHTCVPLSVVSVILNMHP